jgi:thioredoxin-related protein
MKGPATRIIEIVSNIVIILVAVVVGIAFYSAYFSKNKVPEIVRPSVGSIMNVPGEDFSAAGNTLIVALQQGCHYCSESVPFYQKIINGRANGLHLMALLPEDNRPQYIQDLHLEINDIKQVKFSQYRIGGTPTLILVDRGGKIKNVWMGKLTPPIEQEVLNTLAVACSECTVGNKK